MTESPSIGRTKSKRIGGLLLFMKRLGVSMRKISSYQNAIILNCSLKDKWRDIRFHGSGQKQTEISIELYSIRSKTITLVDKAYIKARLKKYKIYVFHKQNSKKIIPSIRLKKSYSILGKVR
jgi:hypothetical protein